MRFFDRKTKGGTIKGKIALYCDALHVTRQEFYWYLKHRDDPWKYAGIAEKCAALWQRMNVMIPMAAAGCIMR